MISGARLTRVRFKALRGTSFRLHLSGAAKLSVRIARSAPGRRHRGTCAAPTARRSRQPAQRCTRMLDVGSLRASDEQAGAVRFAFSGRVGTHRLRPGHYTATLTATNAAGRSRAVKLAFVIVR